MRDLLVIVPSRGRPARLREMLTGCLELSGAQTNVIVATDADDYSGYESLSREYKDERRVMWQSGPRQGLVAWTNFLARQCLGGYRALASFGDDHIPRTRDWDVTLLGAIDGLGGAGIAYPEDLRRPDIPEAPVVSSDIVHALRWFFPPAFQHFYGDNALADIGIRTGCLVRCPEVTVEHMHWERAVADHDMTYRQAEAGLAADAMAYEHWKAADLDKAVLTVAGVLKARR